MGSESVPVIDIADLDRAATRLAIDDACCDWGFFQISNHGIDEALTTALNASRRAYARPANRRSSSSPPRCANSCTRSTASSTPDGPTTRAWLDNQHGIFVLSRLPTRLGPRSNPVVRNGVRAPGRCSSAVSPARNASFTTVLRGLRRDFTAAFSLAATSASSVSVVLIS